MSSRSTFKLDLASHASVPCRSLNPPWCQLRTKHSTLQREHAPTRHDVSRPLASHLAFEPPSPRSTLLRPSSLFPLPSGRVTGAHGISSQSSTLARTEPELGDHGDVCRCGRRAPSRRSSPDLCRGRVLLLSIHFDAVADAGLIKGYNGVVTTLDCDPRAKSFSQVAVTANGTFGEAPSWLTLDPSGRYIFA